MDMKKTLLFRLSLALIILEIYPTGAVLNFANDSGEAIRKTFSYFSLTPFGYANFGPFLTAILSCFIVIFSLVFRYKNSKALLTALKILYSVALITSLMPFMQGISFVSVLGIIISLIILIETIIAFIIKL